MAYNVPMTTLDNAKEVALTYIEAGIIPLLISAPGVGKTTLARAIAAKMGAELRPIRLNNISPEEASGLQYIDREGQHSVHLPPHWLPNPDGSDGPILVFIDEISQASDENRKAVMSALLERYLGNTKVADNCYFMAAGNSSDDGTNVYEFDRATADRFGVIRIRADVESWCNDYAPAHNIDLGLVAFLRIRPDAFEMSEEMGKGDDVIGPSPRTWEKVNAFLKVAETRNLPEEQVRIGVMGKLGVQVGTALMAARQEALQLKSISALLTMRREDRRQHTPKTLEALWVYCQGMIWHATTINRIADVFDLLDSFDEIEGVPFYETRFTVAEMILNRAPMHDIDTNQMNSHPGMVALMRKWQKEMRDMAVPTNDAEEVGFKKAA